MQNKLFHVVVVMGAALTGGCGGASEGVDAATAADSSTQDTASMDGMVADAGIDGASDAGTDSGALPDTGSPDGAPTDVHGDDGMVLIL